MNSPSSHEQKHRRVKSLEQTGRQSTQSDAKTKELSRKKNYSYLPSNLPSVVHDKRYLDKRKTINAFLKKRDFDLIMGTVDSSKKKAVIISKHASVEQVSSQAKHNMQSYVNFKQKQGQMFTHELWSGAHYSKMLKLSGLAQRKQDVHLENELKSTEEKLKELDILFQKLNSKVPIVPEAMKLINHAKERANELEIRPFEPLSSYKQFKLQKRPISPQNQVTLIQSTETDLKRTVLSKGEAKSPESPRLRGKMMNHLAATLSNSSSLTNVQSCLHSGYTSKSQSPLLPRKPQTQRGINSSIPFPTDSAQENWKNQQQITSKIRSSSESAFQNTLNLHNNQHIVREKRKRNLRLDSIKRTKEKSTRDVFGSRFHAETARANPQAHLFTATSRGAFMGDIDEELTKSSPERLKDNDFLQAIHHKQNIRDLIYSCVDLKDSTQQLHSQIIRSQGNLHKNNREINNQKKLKLKTQLDLKVLHDRKAKMASTAQGKDIQLN